MGWEKLMQKQKILIVDDEQGIIDLIVAYLKPEGYELRTALDGVTGLQIARSYKPDLIVLDILLPGMDGIELLTQLRRESDAYVILVSAKTEEVDKIVGLSVGADDYLTKPFSPRELVARIKASFRRISNPSPSGLESSLLFEHLRIDQGSRQVWVNENLIELTAIEFDLLRTLAEHHGMVLSRQQLLEKVWGHDYFGEIRVVDVHLGHIRQKLGDGDYVVTVRGVGYRFVDKRL
jgi:two-component system alkaline phosphatase synthesis response regulator PhoP